MLSVSSGLFDNFKILIKSKFLEYPGYEHWTLRLINQNPLLSHCLWNSNEFLKHFLPLFKQLADTIYLKYIIAQCVICQLDTFKVLIKSKFLDTNTGHSDSSTIIHNYEIAMNFWNTTYPCVTYEIDKTKKNTWFCTCPFNVGDRMG